MGQGRIPRRARCDQPMALPPAYCRAEPCCFPPAWAHAIGRCAPPMSVLLFSHFPFPWTKHGDYFVRFAGVPTCTAMLSPFHIRNSCSERESGQTRNLGSYSDCLTLSKQALCRHVRWLCVGELS